MGASPLRNCRAAWLFEGEGLSLLSFVAFRSSSRRDIVIIGVCVYSGSREYSNTGNFNNKIMTMLIKFRMFYTRCITCIKVFYDKRSNNFVTHCTCVCTRVPIAGWTILCGFGRARVRHICSYPALYRNYQEATDACTYSRFCCTFPTQRKRFYERFRTCRRERPVLSVFFFTIFLLFFHFIRAMNSRTRFPRECCISLGSF